MRRRLVLAALAAVPLTVLAPTAQAYERAAPVTYGSLNVLRTNPEWEVAHDLRRAVGDAGILGLQEAASPAAVRAVRTIRRRADVAGFVPRHGGREDAILWDQRRFAALPGHGRRRTYRGKAHVSPARFVTWQPLHDRRTGLRILVLNTHAVNGYTVRRDHEAFRRASARAHWRTVRGLTSRFVSSGRWDVILLVGDFNARLGDRARRWYPGPVLRHRYAFDHARTAIDRTLYARGTGGHVSPRRRWEVRGLYSDHDLQLRRVELTR